MRNIPFTHSNQISHLEFDTVHIWRVRIPDAPDIARHSPLSPDEQVTAASFLCEHDQAQYRFCRTALRNILGAYVGEPPEALRFHYGSQGKPSLSEPHAAPHFNASHSRDWFLCAVAKGSPVGIDIEYIRPDVNCEAMAARILSTGERKIFRTLSQAEKVDAIFQAWTRKEAYVKAFGAGIFFPFDAITSVRKTSTEQESLSVCGDPRGQRHVWSLAAPDNYAAALVADAKVQQVLYFECTDSLEIAACS